MVKITLISPPDFGSKYREFLGMVVPPLGLAYIAAVLEQHGYKVSIIDAPALNMTYKDIAKTVYREKPDIVGIQALTPTIYNAFNVAKLVRKVLPETTIVMGGYHPTFADIETLKECKEVDVCVRGEGEYTMLDIVKNIEKQSDFSRVLGITYRNKSGRIVRNPNRPLIKNLDELPFPARHLLPMDKYMVFGMKVPATTIVCSRGCPMRCSFCASSAMYGGVVRFRSPENVVAEIEHVKEKYEVKMIAFVDDTFTLFRRWVNRLCDRILEKKLDIIWGAAARVDTLNLQTLIKMKKSGCSTLFFGIESGVEFILKNIGKTFTLRKVMKVFEWCRKLGIRIIASFALGFPGETLDTIRRTIEFAKKLKPDFVVFSIATPYPGTAFFKECLDKGILKIKDWSKYTLLTPIIETTSLKIEEVKKMLIKAYEEFYFRPLWWVKTIAREKSVGLSMLVQVFSTILRKILV